VADEGAKIEDERARLEIEPPTEQVVRFARGLRHQLGNVLTPVVAFGELLSGDPDLSEDARSDVKAINEAAARGSELVERLLTAAGLSRVELVQMSVLDLAEAVEESWPREDVRTRVMLALDNGTRHTADQADLVVAVDMRLVVAALSELAANTARAKASGATISIGVDGEECVLRVDDDGVGVPSDQLAFVCEAYSSSQHSSARGLGLAVVNGIAKALKGRMVIESGLGLGLAVELRWPAFGVDDLLVVPYEGQAVELLDEDVDGDLYGAGVPA
jgi:signal transduction histidine kinase